MASRGFTLIEVLLALAILSIIVAIVYGSFDMVLRSVDMTREAVAEVRARQFLQNSFTVNLGSVYIDKECSRQIYGFIGTDAKGLDGPNDSMEFCSSAPALGGLSFPGDLKQVRYELLTEETYDATAGFGGQRAGQQVAEDQENGDQENGDQEAALGYRLQATETPLLATGAEGLKEEIPQAAASVDAEAPSWTLETIRSVDFKYYDGVQEKWFDAWDSMELGRLPWCVHIRINFAKSEEEMEAERLEGYTDDKDPDFEMVVVIPQGVGMREAGTPPGEEPKDEAPQ